MTGISNKLATRAREIQFRVEEMKKAIFKVDGLYCQKLMLSLMLISRQQERESFH